MAKRSTSSSSLTQFRRMSPGKFGRARRRAAALFAISRYRGGYAEVDCGRYPVKRVMGEPCVVEADIFRDGDHVLHAVIKWRARANAILRVADGARG